MVSQQDLQRAFKNAVRRAYYATYTPARLGRPDGGGSYTFDVPGGRGMTYVRIYQQDGVTLAQAVDHIGVTTGTPTGDLPIWLDKDPDGRWRIVMLRHEG